MTAPSVRTITPYPTSSPAIAATHQELRGRHRSSVTATMSRNVNSDSAMIRCSSSMMYPSRRTGSVAIADQVLDTLLRRSRT